jgi:hypothetical protein
LLKCAFPISKGALQFIFEELFFNYESKKEEK